jgi:YggT family protein
MVLQTIVTSVILSIAGLTVTLFQLPLLVLYRLISLTLWFYSVSIFIYVILSWTGQGSYNPTALVLSELNEPLLRPVRRMLPSIAGLDLSPMLVLIILQAGLMAVPLPGFLR